MWSFEFYDRDGDGIITGKDLSLALRDVVLIVDEKGVDEGGYHWTDDDGYGDFEAMVEAFDKNKIGGVCYDDFVWMLLGNK